jgi:hypothetical protein
MEDHVILGVHVFDRVKKVPTVQSLLTEYGCSIKTRIGLHHVNENQCSPEGLILLEMFGDPAVSDELASKLSALGGVEVQKMGFGHPA